MTTNGWNDINGVVGWLQRGWGGGGGFHHELSLFFIAVVHLFLKPYVWWFHSFLVLDFVLFFSF